MGPGPSQGAGTASQLKSGKLPPIEALRKAGAHFRNNIVTGIGGKQILVDDPSGNPIELFEPTLPRLA